MILLSTSACGNLGGCPIWYKSVSGLALFLAIFFALDQLLLSLIDDLIKVLGWSLIGTTEMAWFTGAGRGPLGSHCCLTPPDKSPTLHYLWNMQAGNPPTVVLASMQVKRRWFVGMGDTLSSCICYIYICILYRLDLMLPSFIYFTH